MLAVVMLSVLVPEKTSIGFLALDHLPFFLFSFDPKNQINFFPNLYERDEREKWLVLIRDVRTHRVCVIARTFLRH